MTASVVAVVLRRVISDCLQRSGRAMPQIGPDTKVVDGVPGFDSLCGLEATVDLEQQLGITLEDNVFVKEVNGRPRARTFGEVVKAILATINGGRNARK